MSMNRCVRVSSRVLLFPSLAAIKDCTSRFSWSANALKSSSDLANAKVSLPVVRLIFLGGSTPRPSSSLANLGLLIRSFLSTPETSSNSSLRSRVSMRCCSSKPRSKSKVGSINIRRVKSISFTSSRGKSDAIVLNRL